MRLVTTAEMRALERRTYDAGTSEAELMRRAGTAVGHAAAEWLASVRGRTVLVLVGRGNNGGDALIAAEVLWREYGAVPRLYLIASRGDDPLLAWAREAGVPIAVHDGANPALAREWLATSEAVLDGVLGIGGRLPLGGAVAEVLRWCREVHPPWQRRIAVDVPTGVQSDTGQADDYAFEASLTLTTGPAKPGLFLYPGAQYAGRVRALEIGLAGLDDASLGPRTERLEPAEVAQLLPPRPDYSHKGTFGKVLVIGGSERYIGAPCLAAGAAVRVGAGLVTLAVPARVQQALGGRSLETTYLPLPDDPAAPGLAPGHLGALLDAAAGYDAVVLGPGLGQAEPTQRLVALLAEHWTARQDLPPLLIDADALNALAALGDWPHPDSAHWVLTPHPGEMSRLIKRPVREIEADRLGLARAQARAWQQVVVLKGAPSVIAAPDGRASLNAFANAALASAGSGDVLSGIIAGLLAQGLRPFDAAQAGCYVHGLAAELWRAQHGAGGLAVGDLLEHIPAALHLLRGQVK